MQDRQDELSELAVAYVVDQIDGISDRVIDNLQAEFGTAEQVGNASVNDLKAIDGIGPVLARKIYTQTNSAKEYPTIYLDPVTVKGVVKNAE